VLLGVYVYVPLHAGELPGAAGDGGGTSPTSSRFFRGPRLIFDLLGSRRMRPDEGPDENWRSPGFTSLGRRQDGEIELGAQPWADLFDRLVHLGHAAGPEDEVVLAFGQGMQADLDASGCRSPCPQARAKRETTRQTT
jgi:hypothetical protein